MPDWSHSNVDVIFDTVMYDDSEKYKQSIFCIGNLFKKDVGSQAYRETRCNLTVEIGSWKELIGFPTWKNLMKILACSMHVKACSVHHARTLNTCVVIHGTFECTPDTYLYLLVRSCG